VYELPRRGVVTQHAGTFAGQDCITTLFHLGDGRVFAAHRVVGQDLYVLERLAAVTVETLSWRDADGRSRELRVDAAGVMVGLTARGLFSDTHALHVGVLDGVRLDAAQRARFVATGRIDLAPALRADDIVCHCVNVSEDSLRRAINAGATTVHRLQHATGCGTVCGGCARP
jgi:NAD(P)H-nitrite reductase large subunit